jgi:hypothetical protein
MAADDRYRQAAPRAAAAQAAGESEAVALRSARTANVCTSEPKGRAERLRLSEMRCGVNA